MAENEKDELHTGEGPAAEPQSEVPTGGQQPSETQADALSATEVVSAQPCEQAPPENSEKAKVSALDGKRREFILSGNLWKVILKISLPLMMVNAITYLYTIVDSMIASKIGPSAVSTVVVLTQINNMLAAVGAGLASGGMIIISRLIGRNDFDKAKRVANTLISLAVLVSVAIMAVVIPLTEPMLRLFRTPEALIGGGKSYFILQMITTGIMLFNTVFLGLEKARGKTRNIFLLNLAVMSVKVLLSLLFVNLISASLMMIALSTLIANAGLSVYVIVRLLLPRYLFRYSFKNISLKWRFIKPIFTLSFPIFLGKFIFSLGKVIINGMCEHYGESAVGALGVSNNMGGYVTNVLGSVEETGSLIISSNLGRNNQKRAIGAFYRILILNLVLSVVGVIIMTIFNDPIVNFYAEGDAEFARLISEIFRYEKLGIVALSINSSVLSLLYGFGYTKISMAVNLSRLFVFRIPSLFILMRFTSLGVQSIGLAMMISNIGIGVMSIFIGIVYLLKIKKSSNSDKMQID